MLSRLKKYQLVFQKKALKIIKLLVSLDLGDLYVSYDVLFVILICLKEI